MRSGYAVIAYYASTSFQASYAWSAGVAMRGAPEWPMGEAAVLPPHTNRTNAPFLQVFKSRPEVGSKSEPAIADSVQRA
jgi:hypothetical protein